MVAVLGVPAESTRRVPVGGGLGVLLGWATGAGTYARPSHLRKGIAGDDDDQRPGDDPPAPGTAS